MRSPVRPRPATAVALAFALAVVAGCTQVVPGRASAALSFPTGGDSLGSATLAAVEDIWREEFPRAFGEQWRDITTVVPVFTDDPAAGEPPCVRSVAEVSGQAFYCPSADAVAWDADGLLPQLNDRFGQAGVAVVLAHEVGHAVQSRLGLDEAQARNPAQYPTILLEAMADCYAGMVVARLSERSIPGLPMGQVERDDAILALVGFRDPLGVAPTDQSAHGNAFDRVSAFQDGFTEGTEKCAAMTLQNREFTQRRFGSADDLARGGDLPLTELLDAVELDAQEWFGTLLPGFVPPPLSGSAEGPVACAPDDLAAQGPARYCADDGTVSIDRRELAVLHDRFGDYAAATLVVSRYAMATLDAAGTPTVGPDAGAAALCLSGSYTGRLIDPDGGFALSPGDLDEAVTVMLTGDWPARDSAGDPAPGDFGFERVDQFRTGLLEGPTGCLTP
ncbi:MAG TPA: neutral zinc metallopeptidase [Pseudonocardia sp.]|nr:neutral zinc metallopeptidase [Pseudonocardia sp.]